MFLAAEHPTRQGGDPAGGVAARVRHVLIEPREHDFSLKGTRHFLSTEEMLRIAQENPNQQVVFFAFESLLGLFTLIEDIDKALKGLLEPVYQDKLIGRFQVMQLFHVRRVTVAGGRVTEGKAERGTIAHVKRDGVELFSGGIASLKPRAKARMTLNMVANRMRTHRRPSQRRGKRRSQACGLLVARWQRNGT